MVEENTNSSTNLRFIHIEDDMREVKDSIKEQAERLADTNKIISEASRNEAKNQVYMEKIFENLSDMKESLANNKLSVDENLKKATATETLALNLKTVQDIQTKDIQLIKDRPMANFNSMKWIVLGVLISNVFGIVVGLWVKYSAMLAK